MSMANSKIYLGNTNIGSLFQGASDISIYLGENKVYPSSPTPPTPTGSTCYEIISTPITSYTPSEYGSVYSFADSKWYMKNNLDNMEEYGVYDIVNDISTATTYEGKLGVVGETEYQYSGGSWSVVGTYVSTEVTYTIDKTSPSPYVGQELSTTFKIPYADFNNVNLTIKDNNGGDLVISSSFFSKTYKYQSYNGTVTNDGKYYYLSLPSEAPQSIVISSVVYSSSTPIHIIFTSKQPTVKYTEKDMPLGNVYDTVAEMEAVGCPNVGVGQYGVVSNDTYQFDGEDWNSASNYKVMEKNADGKAYVLVCNSSTDLVKEEAQPSYFGNITDVVIGDYCVTSIGNKAFSGCSSFTSCTIGNGVTSIGEYAFRSCSGLASLTIPNSVTSIGQESFNACKSLTSVTIPDSVTSIGSNAFANCSSLTSCTIGSGVTSISYNAFYYCTSLTNIVIPDNVESIDGGAFLWCKSLTSCTIGSGATSIGSNAFGYCSGLTSVTVNATTPPTLVDANAFTNTNDCPIYVPSQSVNAYKTATNWGNYASRIQAIP